MALSPEQAKQKAADASTAAAEEKVAIFLKKQFGNISIIPEYRNVADPKDVDDETYRTMARQLITERKFDAPSKSGGTVEVTLEKLDTEVTKLQPEMKSALGVKHLDELVPTRKQLDATAEAIGNGVKDNTGSIGFLGGATFMNAMKGLMKWIGGLFTGKSSFSFASIKESIAQVTADSMQNSVMNNLTQLREKDPKMDKFLTDDTIKSIGTEVNNTVRTEAGFAAAPAASNNAETLESTKPETISSNKLAQARTDIRESILNPEEGTPLADKMATEMIKAKNATWTGRNFGWIKSAETRLTKAAGQMAPLIADTISTTVTDPSFRTKDGKKLADLDKKEFADTISDEVGKVLSAHEKDFNVPSGAELSYKSADGKTNLDKIKDGVRASLNEDATYKQLSTIAHVTARAESLPGDTRKLANRAVNPKAAIGGAQNADHGNKSAPPLASNPRSRNPNDSSHPQGGNVR